MKNILTLLICLTLIGSMGAVNSTKWAQKYNDNVLVNTLPEDAVKMNINKFLELTPKQYKEITGKKLGIVNTVKLKAAQTYVKHTVSDDGDISKGIYILLAILGLGWVAMGILTGFEGSDWIINLILTFLCWLPGLIHALVKMKTYYP